MTDGFSFRFRGRTQRLLSLYQLFQDQPGKGLHPATIARQAGMSIIAVDERLQRTPELFVRLPKRHGEVTRYRLTSAATAMSEDEVRAMINRHARKETLLLWAFTSCFLLMFAIMLILIGPVV